MLLDDRERDIEYATADSSMARPICESCALKGGDPLERGWAATSASGLSRHDDEEGKRQTRTQNANSSDYPIPDNGVTNRKRSD